MNFYLRGNDAATGYPFLARSTIEHTDPGPTLRAFLMLKSSTEPFKNCNP
jgi:hypothetical protein